MIILLSLLSLVAAKSDIITITGDLMPQTAMAAHDFSVVSFHTESKESKDIDSIMEGAKRVFDQKVAAGEWEERSLGWYRINLMADPDYGPSGTSRDSDQMITGFGQKRMIGYHRTQPTPEGDEELFAKIVNELTGMFVHTIDCDDILETRYAKNPAGEISYYTDEVIYFGPKDDFKKGGVAEDFMQLAVMDKYNFDEQIVGFIHNEDP